MSDSSAPSAVSAGTAASARAPGSARQCAERRSDLVEREVEQTLLTEAVRRAAAGRGGVVLVEGPAGIGKSALLRFAADEAQRCGLRVLTALGTELERDYTYGGVRQLLEPVWRAATPTERDGWLDGPATVVGDLIASADEPTAAPPGPVDETTAPEYGLLHGLYWSLVHLADQRPLLVVLDDYQWLDEATRGLAAFVGHRLAATPVLLVVGNRAGGSGRAVPSDLRRTPGLVQLAPTPLGADGIATLGDRLLQDGLPAGDAATVREATGGVPFYVTALLRHRARAGPAAGSSPTEVAEAPAVVTRTVVGQLEGEGAAATRLARAMAVLGPTESLALVADVAGVEIAEVRTVLGRLSEVGLVARDVLTLAHPIIAAAVLGELSVAEESGLHRRAAARLWEEPVPPERVAAHLLRTTAEQDPWAVGVLRRAADTALRRGGAPDAVTYLTRALQEAVEPSARLTVRWELGRALAGVSPEDAIEHLGVVVEHGREAPWWPDAARRLAGVLAFVNRPAEALALVDRVVAEVGVADPRAARMLVDRFFFAVMADPAGGEQAGTEAVQARLDAHDPDVGRLLLGARALDLARVNAPVGEVATRARRAWGTGDLLDVEPPGSHLHSAPLYALVACGDLERAGAGIERLLTEARRVGSRGGMGIALMLRATVRHQCGDLPEAEADAEEAIDHVNSAIPYLAPMTLAVLVAVMVERGRLGEARAVMDRRGDDIAAVSGSPVDGHRIANGLIALAEQRYGDAAVHLVDAGRRDTRFGAGAPTMTPWRIPAALALHAAGDVERSRTLAAEQLCIAEDFGAPYPRAVALRTLAEVGPPGDRRGLLTAAAYLLAGTPYRLEHAHVLARLGCELGQNGETSAAVDALRTAMDVAARCGARPLAEQAADALTTCGVRPRRLAVTGVDALTPSELRVARLAATGDRTNRAIAQELFVTVKTVEIHLTSTYRKLGISSRRELPAALDRDVG